MTFQFSIADRLHYLQSLVSRRRPPLAPQFDFRCLRVRFSHVMIYCNSNAHRARCNKFSQSQRYCRKLTMTWTWNGTDTSIRLNATVPILFIFFFLPFLNIFFHTHNITQQISNLYRSTLSSSHSFRYERQSAKIRADIVQLCAVAACVPRPICNGCVRQRSRSVRSTEFIVFNCTRQRTANIFDRSNKRRCDAREYAKFCW